MIEIYEKYLEVINSYLDKFFEQQKSYIFCQEGCSICCETGTYPLSKIEFDYIMMGYELLSDEVKEKIKKNIKNIIVAKNELGQDKFLHACPFLIDKKCSVYKYRALICRSYGLMSFYFNENGEQRYKIPCCVDQGLNYSNVYDQESKIISSKKWNESGIEVEPVSHNVDLTFLTNNEMSQDLNLEFGELKEMINWF